MAEPTKKEKDLSENIDEQFEKDTERFQELKKKPETERTDAEKKEFGDLRQRYGKAMQKRIDELNWKTKTAEEKATEAEKKATEAEQRAKDAEEKLNQHNKPEIKDSFVDIGGKKYLTDEALLEKINSGEITEAEAVRHQRQRDKEEAVSEAVKRIKDEDNKKEILKVVKEDAESVINKYPHFKKDHPDFNPEDPLYKLTLELYAEGYANNPRGLSLAVKRAEQLLRINKTPIDRSEDFNIEDNTPPDNSDGKKKEITLTEQEKSTAIRMYGRGDVINPKTGRAYTENEALAKALNAKKARMQR